ncbi:MAG: SpoIIE family protein phosphatase [Vicingaceae bacterium]|nr:SpoIIE family protein phosphatase [Vicingaceae bacterium]
MLNKIDNEESDTARIYELNSAVLKLKAQGDQLLALEINKELLKSAEQLTSSDNLKIVHFGKTYVARSYNNNGNIKKTLGDLPGALEDLQKSLALKEENKDLAGQASTLNNIGVVHAGIGNYDLAKQYYYKALKVNRQRENTLYVSRNLGNIATIYIYEGEYDSAKYFINLSLMEKRKINDIKGIALLYSNMAHITDILGDKERTIAYMDTSLTYYRRVNNKGGLAFAMLNSGFIKFRYQDLRGARLLLDSAHIIIEEMKNVDLLMYVHQYLARLDSAEGNYQSSLSHYQTYMMLRDSLLNEESVRKITKSEMQFEFEKKEAIRQLEQEKKDAETQATIDQKNMQRNFLLLILLPLVAIIFLVYRSYKQKKLSGLMLAEKNREITDSINYAKRIQSAILPPDKLVKEFLNDSFVLYKPKDIVAGDFYWMEHSENKVLFAAADCTGHGVPGAMVSVVCNNGLNRSVREYGLTEPGKILDKTREIVIQEFEKSEEEVKDGMDIALCSLEGNKLQYAGAHNPLWIIRNEEIIETKANKQPIGRFDNPEPYTTHSFELEKGDSLYIFSDGYVDQFGGEKGKKFMARAFRELLLSIQDKSMEEQKQIIDEAFETWKGSLEQIDDVCVIGVRV